MHPGPPPAYVFPPPVPPPAANKNRTLLIILAVVTAGLAVLCCGSAGVAVFLLRPRDDQTITVPAVRVHVPAEATPPLSTPTPPAPLEADRAFEGRGSKTVLVPNLPDLVHMVVMTHRGKAGFAVSGIDANGRIAALLGNGYGKFQGTMLLDARERPAALQVRASGAWKLVIRDARRAPLWTGKGSGKASTVLRVEPAWSQPLTPIRYSHRGTSNFVVRSYDGRSWDLLVNEIGRQDGDTTIPTGTRYIEIKADGAWTFTRP